MLRQELRYQSFHRYCQLNVALEASAELAYRRLVELSDDADKRNIIDRIREDEARHTSAFRLLADALNEHDRLVNPGGVEELVTQMAEISIWFVPSRLRPDEEGSTSGLSLSRQTDERPRSFASRSRVAIGVGRDEIGRAHV